MREVLYYHLIRPHTPSAKANFVKLYINDQYWGVYLNVQQLNKDFLEEWYESNDGNNFRADISTRSTPGGGGGGGPQWGDGTAAINYLGSDTTQYQKYYTLKSGGYNNPWTELIHACDVLNNSGSALETTFPEVFDLDKILWHLACEIAFVDDDSYIYKGKMDYYLYQDPITGRWTTYDYDANSTMSNNANRVNWSPFYNATKANYPLLNKVLAIPAFRQRFLAHMRTILQTSFDFTYVSNLIDQYDAMIKNDVFADTKKATSNQDYLNALNTLKSFITNRKNFLMSNEEVKVAAPSFEESNYISLGLPWGKVTKDEQALITSKPLFVGGLSEVNVWISTEFTGAFMKLAMNDAGQQGDVSAGDGIYSVLLPAYQSGTLVRFYIEAVGNDLAKSRAYDPAGTEHHLMFFRVENETSATSTVVINEFMASNDGIIKDEFDEVEDWIELFNLTNEEIDMTGYSITDKSDNPLKYVFPEGTKIKANDYLIVWADEDGTQGPLHTNFKLSAGGELIYLFDKNQVLLDSVTFGQQTPDKSSARIPNGTGNWVIGDHTFSKNNESTSSASSALIQNTLSIFPNPASESFFIENNDKVDIDVTIFDPQGKMISSKKLPALSTTIISDIPSGLYFVRHNSFTRKLVVY
ncbi:MAG: CotH kinase family protein [Saprospiraceae bacterium]|nr:CotH kinase family protein [Saprospiraceae bacterium]